MQPPFRSDLRKCFHFRRVVPNRRQWCFEGSTTLRGRLDKNRLLYFVLLQIMECSQFFVSCDIGLSALDKNPSMQRVTPTPDLMASRDWTLSKMTSFLSVLDLFKKKDVVAGVIVKSRHREWVTTGLTDTHRTWHRWHPRKSLRWGSLRWRWPPRKGTRREEIVLTTWWGTTCCCGKLRLTCVTGHCTSGQPGLNTCSVSLACKSDNRASKRWWRKWWRLMGINSLMISPIQTVG